MLSWFDEKLAQKCEEKRMNFEWPPQCLICRTKLEFDCGECICKCGRYNDREYWLRQKYFMLITKYGKEPEILTEILIDVGIKV